MCASEWKQKWGERGERKLRVDDLERKMIFSNKGKKKSKQVYKSNN
jgi:hypothetical protein